MNLTYRADIEGLRAIAVLSVVLFHLDIPLFQGGFTGVDIFFVISGYLISFNILHQKQQNTFSLKSFYANRIRRLFPALATIATLTFCAGLILLPPTQVHQLSQEYLYSIFSVANIFFWMESGYFDSSPYLKPLLHTWSLSVEEQFYLVWPGLIIVFFFGKHHVFKSVAFTLLFIMSFVASVYLTTTHPSATFYLTPFRMYEFLMGASLAVFVTNPTDKLLNKPIVNDIGFLLGIILIIYSVTALTGESFPGHIALIPCLGAFLLLLTGKHSRGSTLLTNPVMRFIGRISYSLYLVHWPLIVFYGFVKFDDLESVDKILLFFGSLALAYLLHISIENPFRYKNSTSKKLALPTTAVLAAFIVVSLVGIQTKGWENRLPAELRNINSYTGWQRTKKPFQRGNCFISQQLGIKSLNQELCLKANPEKKNVLVYGDSHAAHLIPGLKYRYPEINFLHASSNGCRPFLLNTEGNSVCKQLGDFMYLEYFPLNANNIDSVVLAADWYNEHFIPALLENIQRIQSLGIRVYVVGPTIEYKHELPDIIQHFGVSNLNKIELLTKNYQVARSFSVEKKMKQSISKKATYISIIDSLCNDRLCEIFTDEEGAPITFDHAHFTPEGSRHFWSKLPAGLFTGTTPE